MSNTANQKKTDEARDEVRHEYGHTIQLKQLGVKKYLLCNSAKKRENREPRRGYGGLSRHVR